MTNKNAEMAAKRDHSFSLKKVPQFTKHPVNRSRGRPLLLGTSLDSGLGDLASCLVGLDD